MTIRLEDDLPFVIVTVTYNGQSIELENVLLDTGSAGTAFSIARLLEIGLEVALGDPIHRIRGVGGAEFVFMKTLDALIIGETVLEQVEIEVGALEYGLPLDGILGMDCLLRVGFVIDLATLELRR